MDRITKKMIFAWIDEWNEGSSLKVKITCYNGWYHFENAETGTRLVDGKTARQVWEQWEVFRRGYFTACDIYMN